MYETYIPRLGLAEGTYRITYYLITDDYLI